MAVYFFQPIPKLSSAKYSSNRSGNAMYSEIPLAVYVSNAISLEFVENSCLPLYWSTAAGQQGCKCPVSWAVYNAWQLS